MKKLAFNEIEDQIAFVNVLKSTEIVRVDTEQVSDNCDSEVLFERKKVKLLLRKNFLEKLLNLLKKYQLIRN